MYVKGQSFLVLGISKSGSAAAKYVLEQGGDCYVYEELKSSKIDNAIKELLGYGAQQVSPSAIDEIIEIIDVLVISPGVPINHPIAVKCKENGKRILGEAEFGFLNLSPTIVAVTGTNGKTTTVTLIDDILKEANVKKALIGNVGVPVSSKINEIDKNTICVAEISSFQLESMSDFKPHIACVLNVTPDHLERHYSMENYVFLKKRIVKNLRESEYALLNYDDLTVRGFAEDARAEVVWISLKERVWGAYAENGKLYFEDEFIIDVKELALSGEHNVYNALFAIASAKLLCIDNQAIITALKNFKGVPHRVELIAQKNGVDFYNDSKATNTASTIMAIRTMNKPTVLIVGGSEKGENYQALFETVKTSLVKHTIITGASKVNMFDQASKVGLSDITVTGDFGAAVKIARMYAKEGDAVLLSPACASFDFFTDYEERGRVFTDMVNKCL